MAGRYYVVNLPDKLSQLKLAAYRASRLADFWQRQLDQHGEVKATEFYQHLGLNHVEVKSVDFDGLTLRRQPRPSEALAVKGVAQAQDSARDRLAMLLGQVRAALIDEGLREIAGLQPANYHMLVLDGASDYRSDLARQLVATYNAARLLVVSELSAVKSIKQVDPDDFDELDMLTNVTLSRVTNDVQARIIGATARLATLGLSPATFATTLADEIRAGSVAYIDRTATGLANRTISIGRGDEAEAWADEWGRVEYSALLDQNVCGPCSAADGETAASEADLTPAPNPECQGGDWCRCFLVYVRD